MFNFFEKIQQSPYVPTARTTLMVSVFLLLITSLMMIASSSMPFAINHGLSELRFFWMQLMYIAIGLVAGLVVYRIRPNLYLNFTFLAAMWVAVLCLLVVTLLIADPINGAKRWLDLGFVNLQTAEFAKLVMVFVIADYVVRRSAEVRKSIWAGWRLLVWYLPIIAVLLFQPDFGSSIVIVATAGVILFVSGVPKRHFFTLMAALGALATLVLWSSDYRRQRILSFSDPFDDIINTDYQLARSLVAYARGQIDGVGYGNSILKLLHLPESHTDFLLAITGEELGLIGVCFVLLLQACVVGAIMKISHTCLKRRQLRLSYIAFGFGIVLFGQIFINAGMTLGLLPTKGLTLPLYSYGGSSMLVSMIMIAIILKIDRQSLQIYNDNKNREY